MYYEAIETGFVNLVKLEAGLQIREDQQFFGSVAPQPDGRILLTYDLTKDSHFGHYYEDEAAFFLSGLKSNLEKAGIADLHIDEEKATLSFSVAADAHTVEALHKALGIKAVDLAKQSWDRSGARGASWNFESNHQRFEALLGKISGQAQWNNLIDYMKATTSEHAIAEHLGDEAQAERAWDAIQAEIAKYEKPGHQKN